MKDWWVDNNVVAVGSADKAAEESIIGVQPGFISSILKHLFVSES